MINVTKTYLPAFEKYTSYLKRAWDKAWVTNNGELVRELEERLKEYLGVKHLFFTNNGTIVLQMALKVYNITKEVITTPFSYVATTNALLWENCTPVFVDINTKTFCIDENRIEQHITQDTQAILATHVYGYPCAVEKLEELGQKYNLKIIYDGAHAFGCTYQDASLLSYGDISTCSFHATKIFHSVEGGCIITNDDDTARQLMLYRQFGHINDDYYSVGINAKNSEFHAAMGLCVLDDLPQILELRKERSQWYDEGLKNLPITRPSFDSERFVYNHSYYPVVFSTEQVLLKVRKGLEEIGINSRRYFYPSLNRLPYHNGNFCPVSENTSLKVLSLPLFHDLEKADLDRIVGVIKKTV